MKKQRIAIFASGTGSNAMNLIRHFEHHETIEVGLVLSNKQDAPIVQSAKNEGAEVVTLNNENASDGKKLVALCRSNRIDWIVLAGYLRLVPAELIKAYAHKIINLHPSLLPKYGGKGMYGKHVHEAVLSNTEKQSGITIHFVNEEFDKGNIIAQFYCEIDERETVRSLEQKIRLLEQGYLPIVIEKTILNADKQML